MKQILLYLTLLASFSASAQHFMGLDEDEAAYDAVPLKANLTRSLYDGINMPPKASLKDYCPPVGDQRFNDCVGWANSYGARSILFNKKHNRTGDSAAIFSPTYLHRSVATNCEATAITEKALGFLKEVGTVPFVLLDYGCMENMPAESLKKLAGTFRITEYERLFMKDEQNGKTKVLKVKKALSEGQPVIIGMDIYQSFMDAEGQEIWTPVIGDAHKGGHAMVVVGYDDNKEGGAFEIMNSWGDDWGKKGFLWVKYTHFGAHVKRAYTMAIDNHSNEAEEDAYEGMIKPGTNFGQITHAPPIPKDTIAKTPTETTKPTIVLSPFEGSLRLVTTDNVAIPLLSEQTEADGMNIPASNAVQTEIITQLPFYTTEKSYQNGTGFRIYVQNMQTAYVYVLGLDVNGTVSCLFPYEKGISPRLDYAKNEIALPDEDHFYELEDPAGDEWMCVLYAKSKLNIENAMNEITKESGNLLERVQKVFGEQCVQATDIQYNEILASFQAKVPVQSVVPLVIKIKHVK